jgi:hypothetical protein
MGDTVQGGGSATSAGDDEDHVEEIIRELHFKSKNICFGQKNVCGVYVSEGPISDNAIEQIQDFEKEFAGSAKDSFHYTWMWMDVSQEANFKTTFDVRIFITPGCGWTSPRKPTSRRLLM